MKNRNKKGFTLVELVIVIAVIAILAGVLIGTFAGVLSKAEQSKEMQELKNKYTEYLVDVNYTTSAGVEASQAKYVIVGTKYAFTAESGQFDSTALEYTVNDSATAGTAGKVIKANKTLYVGTVAYTITATKTSLTAGTNYAMALTDGYTNFYVLWTEPTT